LAEPHLLAPAPNWSRASGRGVVSMKVQQLWGVSTRVVMWIAGDQEVRIDATGVGTEAARARRRSCSTPKNDRHLM